MTQEATLLVDTSFLGDVLCAEPLIRAVVRKWPGRPVDVLTSPGGAEILQNHPDLREILVFDKRGADKGMAGLYRVARNLRERGYARAICSHRSWRSAMLLRVAGIPERVGFHNASAAWLYTRRVPYPAELHEVERNLALLDGGPWERPRMHPSPAERARAAGLVPAAPFVAMAPGSIWFTKRWPAERFAEVLSELVDSGLGCVLLGGGEDRGLAREVVALATVPSAARARVVDLVGRTNLRESYAVLQSAAALVTNDSAPMHLGVAAGIPVVAVYCSTLPGFGFAPRGASDQVLEVNGLACRPCGIHGHESCPEGHFRCAWDLPAERVAVAVASRVKGAR